MSCDDIDFVAFGLTAEPELRFLLGDSLPKLRCHLVDNIPVEAQFLRDLQIRYVQAHQVEADHPSLQWLVMSAEDGIREVIEVSMTIKAEIALTACLSLIVPVLSSIRRFLAFWRGRAHRPSKEEAIAEFLTYEAVDRNVSGSTQKAELNEISDVRTTMIYLHVLNRGGKGSEPSGH